ncbi:MAG: hypothetical protein PHY90_09550 [Desulfitobacteriaceae bacterium]|nr:hypothetical protein [Desulfitobacteriaceae bacterium]
MDNKEKQPFKEFMVNWIKENFSAIVIMTFLFVIFLVVVFALREQVLISFILFFMFGMIFVFLARAKEDESLNIRTNALLIKFYLKNSFLLFVISVIMAFIFTAQKLWPFISSTIGKG